MKRWWDSVAVTIVLTVVVAMVLGVSLQQMASAGLSRLGLAPREATGDLPARLAFQLPGKIATLIDMVDAGPDTERPAVMMAAQRVGVRARILDAYIPWLVLRSDPETTLLHSRIESLLTTPHTVVVADGGKPADGQKGFIDADATKRGVLVEASLADGRWLLLSSAAGPASPADIVNTDVSRIGFALWLTLFMLCAVSLSILAERRLVRPLAGLARAVEQLGGSGAAPPAPAFGPREVKRTIEAFNRMQERLRRFNNDRTRMVAAMSHDLKTPLTRLRLRLETAENLDGLGKMFGEIDTMGVLIESMRAFAQDDADH